MINKYSCINIYEHKKKNSKLSSQILYGEKFIILKEYKDWYKIKTSYDKYVGFIKKKKFEKFTSKPTHKVSSLKANIFFKPIKNSQIKKPVVGFISGQTAPKGRTMGHAGAIVGGKDDTAEAKKEILKSCGIHVVDSPANIGEMVKKVLK